MAKRGQSSAEAVRGSQWSLEAELSGRRKPPAAPVWGCCAKLLILGLDRRGPPSWSAAAVLASELADGAPWRAAARAQIAALPVGLRERLAWAYLRAWRESERKAGRLTEIIARGFEALAAGEDAVAFAKRSMPSRASSRWLPKVMRSRLDALNEREQLLRASEPRYRRLRQGIKACEASRSGQASWL